MNKNIKIPIKTKLNKNIPLHLEVENRKLKSELQQKENKITCNISCCLI